jgi:transcription-repair coupling factor (superfamily II helicase)
MGGSDWARTRTAVRYEIEKIAEELVALYQQRESKEGYSFSPDTPWQTELEESFAFIETTDQITAMNDVKNDMEQKMPMDRLVCGDVGFGKTEIALRAAFKAVQDSKQVALLVPTTLLAQQHYQTFTERLDPFPIEVATLSRFLSDKEAKQVIAKLRNGKVDLVIGTHRLLSEDIEFKDLGLLIIDEEQRFGVSHKEKIKSLKSNVDVLTLTATPIPRTLEMSLTGIRDLTLLNTPPTDRKPIMTYVGEYENSIISAAIRREILRDGQVFFVHNKISDIEIVAEKIREQVPSARIATAHGQMDEGTLERTVINFWEKKYDVLVCTTIIESGIDMPSVNTLIVDNADRMGLGQLHQLRGRVGRSGTKAYAYLLTPKGKKISEDATERLKTVGETSELGSGFKIAMRDLEIRGAGNLLGTGQSGHIAAVGYDLYCKLVKEAVEELKEIPEADLEDVEIDIPMTAFIPKDYITRDDAKLEAYRAIADAKLNKDLENIQRIWLDRYGPIPDEAINLFKIAYLRVTARTLGIKKIIAKKIPGFGKAEWNIHLSPLSLRPSQRVRTLRLYEGSLYKEGNEELILKIPEINQASQEITDYLTGLKPNLK